MKTVILAGGYGTRLGEYTTTIPKPMVTINGIPIIQKIMNIYSKFGHSDFLIAGGYKCDVIKQYFSNFSNFYNDIEIDFSSGNVSIIDAKKSKNWKVTIIDTGENVMTGGRLKRLEKYLDEPFFLTYGDGVCDIDINKLRDFHYKHGKMATVTAVRPNPRFGELKIDGENVRVFAEKPQISQGWINGGFFVFEPDFLDNIDDDNTVLERKPLEMAAANGKLMAFKNEGFWMCMDTKRDLDALSNLEKNGHLTFCDD